MFLSKMIRSVIKRIIRPHTYSSEAYVKYLKKKGVTIGKGNFFVNPNSTFIDIGRAEYIKIGDNNCFSGGAVIAHDYSWYVLAEKYGEIIPDPGGKITIGNNVFLGYQSVVLKGVTIGDNVIIGARSVVTKDIPDNTVVAGSPAKVIMGLDEYYYHKKESSFADFKWKVSFFKEKHKRMPNVQELGLFAFYFLERNEENFETYIKNIEFNGQVNNPVIRKIFFNTVPKYNNYSQMISELDVETRNE